MSNFRMQGLRVSDLSVADLGSFLREQRLQSHMSLRQLAEVAGVSNPYLSQIERGLRNPSAEVLQQLARALKISSEALYVRAGLLHDAPTRTDTMSALATDPQLTAQQQLVMIQLYQTFLASNNPDSAPGIDAESTQATPKEPVASTDVTTCAVPAAAKPRRRSSRKKTRTTVPKET